MDSVVPTTPSGVCFKREQFTEKNFSSDVFLQDLWNTVPLEVLRDDLGAYLKVLRSAMIELINRDYADFVNLSGNLVGLDKAIANLQDPIAVIHSEIMVVAKVIDEAHDKLQFALSERQSLREKKLVLECLMKIPSSLDHLEKLLINASSIETMCEMEESENPTDVGSVMERAGNELNRLQHLLVKCHYTSTVVTDLQKRTDSVSVVLMKRLEDSLIYAAEHQKREVLHKILRTYFLLDQCKVAITLLRFRLIGPAFAKIVNQSSLTKDPQDLNGLLTKLKEFIRNNYKHLLEISGSFEGLQGFNFVIDCLWPEFYEAVVGNLDSIFAQGNPALFHKRYSCTMEFISYLESMSNRSGELKSDQNFQLLIGRFNLPVYFQLRFQELAGDLEAALVKPFRESDEQGKTTANFACTSVLLSLLNSCFDPDIYLPLLAHRFYKLTLQMMARYQKKSSEILLAQSKRCEVGSVNPSVNALTQSSSSSKLTELDTSQSSCFSALTVSQLVMWDSDIRLIMTELPNVWNSAWKQLNSSCTLSNISLEGAFQTSVAGFENLLPNISRLIVRELTGQCTTHLRNVADIPRLYRRTNKETPTKCFAYVYQSLEPLRAFTNQHSGRRELSVWTRGVLEALSKQYLVAVSDVLTSVQKTEESLKRLRKDRSASASAGISDDDKIRMQLVIDADSFVKEAAAIVADAPELSEIKALLDAVEPARVVFRATSTT